MSKVLITGGSGFIGYHLAKTLSADSANEVVILDNFFRGKMDSEMEALVASENISFITGDITDTKVLANLPTDFDYIYHLAAVIGVKNVLEMPDKVLSVNAITTINMLDFCRKQKNLKRFLFSSTSEIYAGTLKHFGMEVPTPETTPITIDDLTSARTSYALSKAYGESLCNNYAELHSVPVTIVRYHNVYGPRMGFLHVIPELICKMTEKKEVEIFSPQHTRAFCYVDDAVQFTIRATESDKCKNQTLNIGNEKEEVAIKTLAKTVANTVGKEVALIDGPETPGSPKRRCPSIQTIVELTDYNPEVSLARGVELTYEWYKDRLDQRYE